MKSFVAFVLLVAPALWQEVTSFSSSSTTTSTTRQSVVSSTSASLSASKQSDLERDQTSLFSPTEWLQSSQRRSKRKCQACPDEESETTAADNQDDANWKDIASSNKDMDRREAAFAMLGTLWATTSTMAAFTANPQPTHAVYGAEPKIELPNMAQGMSDRANKQCLVESLGNRECLVYMDPENKLYQGADSQKLLQKVDLSSVALTKIPALVEAKKWSGVKSIITGPMGELLSTMNLLAPLSTQSVDKSAGLAKQVKLQIFAISAAADRKDGASVLKSTQGATDALVAFVQSL